MTIRDIQYIAAIAEEHNITRAAQRLFISQPSLSQVLKKVEAELHVSLFNRAADGLQPTFIGEEFLLRSKEILSSYQKLEQFIAKVNELETGRIRIGVPYYLNGSFLSAVLPGFSEAYPGIAVDVTQGTDTDLDARLSQSALDFLIGIPDAVSSRFQQLLIFSCRLILSVPSGVTLDQMALQKKGERYPTLPLSVLTGKTFLDYDAASPMHALTERLLSRADVGVTHKLLSGYGLEMVRRCSKAGLGYAVIPECMLISRRDDTPEKYYYLENSEDIQYSICAAWNAEIDLPLAARRFIEMSKDYFQETRRKED